MTITSNSDTQKNGMGKLLVCVRDACVSDPMATGKQEKGCPISKAIVKVFSVDSQVMPAGCDPVAQGTTGDDGCCEFQLLGGKKQLYRLTFEALGYQGQYSHEVEMQSFCIECDKIKSIDLTVPLGLKLDLGTLDNESNFNSISGEFLAGSSALVRVQHNNNTAFDDINIVITSDQGILSQMRTFSAGRLKYSVVAFDTFNETIDYTVRASCDHPDGSKIVTTKAGMVVRNAQNTLRKKIVSMARTESEPTADSYLWTLIRNSTEALSFNNYLRFMDELFCTEARAESMFPNASDKFKKDLKYKRYLPFTDTDAYRLLKAATESFVMVNCGIFDLEQGVSVRAGTSSESEAITKIRFYKEYLKYINDKPMLPYLAVIYSKLPELKITNNRVEANSEEADLCFGFVKEKLFSPCLMELIWSYWHEEGMLTQTMNAITRRFQNVRSFAAQDPLANMEIDPLRPLNNLIWGYTQDEQHRLSVMRRNYEYDHHYGMRLEGKAVQNFRPVDTRSKFLEAFHHLLRLCTAFYKQDDDTTVKADAFPILNALKEVHLILSQGAHGQFGDLPSTARIEMLMQQWLLARPEFREFLPTRLMVAYPEPWMDRVDAMKKLQGWTDTSVGHFRSLAVFGEQLLLSIRYGHWSDVYEANQALNWTRYWRPQVQGYIHAYRAATGVELAGDTVDSGVDATLPSLLLQKRLAMQHRGV